MSKKPSQDLPRDTPVDTPRVDVAMAVPAEPGKAQLAALKQSETLESAYAVWDELRATHRSVVERFASERKRLKDEGDFMVGTVEAAKRARAPLLPGNDGLVKARDADAFLKHAKEKLSASAAQLDQLARETESAYQQALTTVRHEVRSRVERYLQRVRPQVRLMLRVMPQDQRVLHVARVGPDEAVLLCFLLNGRVPSRYGYLFDDSANDVKGEPPHLYADEGVAVDAVSPDPSGLKDVLNSSPEVLPVKACIPLLAPVEGTQKLAWLKQRGPVMEAELEEGDVFRHLLQVKEAEAIAAVLLKLKLEGKIELEWVRE